MEATITKNGLVYSVDMKTIYYADDSGEFKGTIPNGVERIEDEAFSCCAVEKIYIPDSVTSVGANLFENATSLKSVRLPSSKDSISKGISICSRLEQPANIYGESFFNPEGNRTDFNEVAFSNKFAPTLVTESGI